MNDSPNKLEKDILTAGAQSCWLPAVRQLCEKGPELVQSWLVDRLQIPFDKNPLGEFHFTSEAVHSDSRILHLKDQTAGESSKEFLKIFPTIII